MLGLGQIRDRIWNLRHKARLVSKRYSIQSLVVTEISQNTLTLTLRRALTLTLESAIFGDFGKMTDFAFDSL